MDIFGRNPTPDKYKIKSIRVSYDVSRFNRDDDGNLTYHPDGKETLLTDLYLLVDLEPDYYMRDRFIYGHSYEKKKNPCTLRIKLSELQEMQQAISSKSEECFQSLLDNGLLDAFLNPEKTTKKAG